MEPIQSAMARAALGWARSDLAKAAGIGVATVVRFETGERVVQASIDAMSAAVRGAGIVLIDADASSDGGGPGVRTAD